MRSVVMVLGAPGLLLGLLGALATEARAEKPAGVMITRELWPLASLMLSEVVLAPWSLNEY